MTDWLTPRQRSRNMANIRSTGNATTERAFLKLLRQSGITGWRRHLKLPGRPDFVFRAQRIAVFIDGCFWHGCPRCYRLPEDNRKYWRKKVVTNRLRDRRRTRELVSHGWKVVRVWEHSLASPSRHFSVLSRLLKQLRVRDPVR